MNIHSLIKLADDLDRMGLEHEASKIDSFLKEASPMGPMHSSGIKEASVEFHKKLLEGYEKAMEYYDEEYKKVMKESDSEDSPNMGDLREILRNQAHNCNAVCLHTMYFEDITDSEGCSMDECEEINKQVEELFDGNCQDLLKELRRAALTSRNGWTMLSFCTVKERLYIDICDLHEIGVSVTSVPVFVIDMWEHAYVNDFGTDKEAYLDWVFSIANWENVSKRIERFKKL